MSRAVLFVLALLSVSACASSGPSPATEQDADLTGAWRIVEIDGSRVEGGALTLDVEPSQLSGAGVCNTYRGPWTRAGPTVRVGPLVSTKRACTDAEVAQREERLLASLQSVTMIGRTRGGQVILSGPSPTRIVLAAIDEDATAGEDGPALIVAGDVAVQGATSPPPGAELRVTVRDIGAGEGSAPLLAESRAPVTALPAPFNLRVSASQLTPRSYLQVRAVIVVGDAPVFSTRARYLTSATPGQPPMHIRLEPVDGPTPAPPPRVADAAPGPAQVRPAPAQSTPAASRPNAYRCGEAVVEIVVSDEQATVTTGDGATAVARRVSGSASGGDALRSFAAPGLLVVQEAAGLSISRAGGALTACAPTP